MTDDSWKGLDKIRIQPNPKSSGESRRLTMALWHHKRREAGVPLPAAKANKAFRNSIFRPKQEE